ncbi:MAG: succinyl-diaminopimelate desuccinylase [Chloroflexota bacterium]|nr:succinyl-diaminopimelate desuccinylase [Chloroflexota bacterium]
MSEERELGRNLAERTLQLVNIRSVSRDETILLEHVEGLLRPLRSFTLDVIPGQGLLALPARLGRRPLVVLAGHVDTVPEQANLPGQREGDSIVGLGASDMKGGLAVMLELARRLEGEPAEQAVDLGLLFFAREELPIVESAVPAIFAGCPRLRQAALIVMMEPTDGTLQIGCLGNLNARIVFEGKSAHSARPWHGDNALHKAIRALRPLTERLPKDVTIGQLTYREVLSLTQIQGGVAQNVIPDRVVCQVNYRYAPNRAPAEAEAELRALTPYEGRLEIAGNAPPARAAVDNPLVERLRLAGQLAVEPKQAWTPVAEFSAEGLDAVNFGPGATRFAHRRDERVEVRAMVESFQVLRRFALAGAAVKAR